MNKEGKKPEKNDDYTARDIVNVNCNKIAERQDTYRRNEKSFVVQVLKIKSKFHQL